MTITVGDKLPQGKMLRVGANGPEAVDSADLSRGRIALFLPLAGMVIYGLVLLVRDLI